jgi:GR25 family glycosyltransferase involved in LPS biosynthesis
MNIEQMPKFVINLERDTHKLTRFSKPMKEQNIEFKIWRGAIITNRKKLHEYNKKFKYTQRTKTIKRPGNVGSSFAHLSLWKYCLTQENDYFMIFEDNCVIKKNFLQNVNKFLKKIKNVHFFNLNVLTLEGITKDKLLYRIKINKNYLLQIKPSNLWMSSYIISKNTIKFLLKIASHIDFDTKYPIDQIVPYVLSTVKNINYYGIKTNHLANHMGKNTDTRKLLNNKSIKLKSYITTQPIDFKL